MASKNKKPLMLVATVVVVGGALLALVFTSFTDSLVYFHTPTEIAQKPQLAGKKVRIGGMVQTGTLMETPGTMKIAFEVTDGDKRLQVKYDGIKPDLFREGQGVVVEGIYRPGQTFEADTILAKHSEDYMPVEMSQEGIENSRKNILKSMQ
ncbi:cytochrome c maturation protein CcmE [Magnetofaba australis]|uniref:Cytochrome c-type biogenesis protein CcmE n=1 Tax=Magnetofaba australis IT-1 TaxID=1434232 RepID=A0A1Y2K1C3_9PROT|nr:cytochrome c maturation protein CcmE [Magnetofaba australis]OSM01477.1 putative CcmE/CycJ protein [Magnetofaba australis IT-1]